MLTTLKKISRCFLFSHSKALLSYPEVEISEANSWSCRASSGELRPHCQTHRLSCVPLGHSCAHKMHWHERPVRSRVSNMGLMGHTIPNHDCGSQKSLSLEATQQGKPSDMLQLWVKFPSVKKTSTYKWDSPLYQEEHYCKWLEILVKGKGTKLCLQKINPTSSCLSACFPWAAPEWYLNLKCKFFFEIPFSALLPMTTWDVRQWTSSFPLVHLSFVTDKKPENVENNIPLSPVDHYNGTRVSLLTSNALHREGVWKLGLD